MPSDVDQNPSEDATGSVDDMELEETRQYVSKARVKDEIVRCLEERLSKDQMFGRFRQSKIDPLIYYAVYKELRSQNEDFFELYLLEASLKRQIERFNRQLAWCRELRRRANASAGGNPSCSGGHQQVAVPVPHAEATPRAMSSTPLALALPAMAMAQHTHRNLPRMLPPPPYCGGRPGSSRGCAVHLFAAGQMPETPWQGAPHVCLPVRQRVPNGWPAGHGHPASGTFAAGMAGSSPPVAQRGAHPCAFHRLPTPQVDAQRQRLPPPQPLQHGDSNVGERRVFCRCRATPAHVQEVRPALPAGEQQQQQQQQGNQAEQRWHAPQVGAQHQNLQHLPQQPLQQGDGNVGERQGQFCPPTPSHVQEQRLPPPSSSQCRWENSKKPTTAAAAACKANRQSNGGKQARTHDK